METHTEMTLCKVGQLWTHYTKLQEDPLMIQGGIVVKAIKHQPKKLARLQKLQSQLQPRSKQHRHKHSNDHKLNIFLFLAKQLGERDDKKDDKKDILELKSNKIWQ
uniref:Uncharacterized protein n=1 Tax=Plectus sambesii TaxID=2011161 RepID=A0A914WCU8_9BILA